MPLLDYALSLLVSALWGGNFVASKIAMEHYPPLLMSGLRFAVVALVLLPFLKKPVGKWKEMAWFAFTLGTLHFAFVFVGMHMGLDVPTSVITTQMGVPFSCILGTIFLNDKLGAWRASGMAVSFVGLLLIAGTPNVVAHFVPFLLVLTGAFAWSVSNIIAKRLSEFPIMSIVGWAALISAPQLLLLSALLESNQWEIMMTAPLRNTLGIAYSVVFSTLVAYSLWYYLLNKHAVSQVVPFSLLIPFFGIGSSMWMLGDELNWQIIMGGIITMAGVAVIVIRKPRIKQQGEAI